MRPPRVKYLTVKKAYLLGDRFPSFSASGSVIGMRKQYYGNEALLVRCGAYIYNVSSDPWIYHKAAI